MFNLTRVFSNHIKISFGLERCGHLIVQRGKVMTTQGLELSSEHIENFNNSYKYPGILQSYGTHDGKVCNKVIAEYRN